MYQTTEIRWFFKGKIPNLVMSAYRNMAGKPEYSSIRSDRYLLLPGKDDLGIKIREGALEIKQRTEDYGFHHFYPHIRGRIESWIKWRFELSSIVPETLKMMDESQKWITIQKERWLRLFTFTTESELIEVPERRNLNHGCEWELSELEIAGYPEKWWSIAFESFGESQIRRDLLINAATYSLKDLNLTTLPAQESKSYPSFLISPY